MEPIPDKRKLVGMVEQAHEGRICLPEFQRDFVWPNEQVADLLRSIFRKYYLGALLILRCDADKPPFAPEFLKGHGSALAKPMPEYLVLDGQQRLTALLYALTAPDYPLKNSSQRRWFFIDLKKLMEDPENDELIFSKTKRELDELDQTEVQYRLRMLPCTKLMRSQDFHKWRDGFDDWLRDNEPDSHDAYRQQWRDIWTNSINDFQNFTVPVVELPKVSETDEAALGRVCAIFEKLNSTGVELSVYDLLTARLYRSNIKLHELWKNACEKNKRLAQWSKGNADNHKFGVLILRTLAIMRGLDPKPSMLINLKPTDFEKDWIRATAAMEHALELLTMGSTDGLGVFDENWIPGYGLLAPLAALRAEIEDRKLGSGPREHLRRWYWCSVFTERYSSAVESKSRKDYAEMLAHWINHGPEPSVFTEARARIGAEGFTLMDSASSSSSIYSGVFCLLALEGAKDWNRGEAIKLQDLHDHHIFPRAYLRDHGITMKDFVNNIVNRTLISDQMNLKIQNTSPSEYIQDENIISQARRDELLKSHFIDASCIEAMQMTGNNTSNEAVEFNYKTFLGARQRLMLSRIRQVCGIV